MVFPIPVRQTEIIQISDQGAKNAFKVVEESAVPGEKVPRAVNGLERAVVACLTIHGMDVGLDHPSAVISRGQRAQSRESEPELA
jgi:hypothetical protein